MEIIEKRSIIDVHYKEDTVYNASLIQMPCPTDNMIYYKDKHGAIHSVNPSADSFEGLTLIKEPHEK